MERLFFSSFRLAISPILLASVWVPVHLRRVCGEVWRNG